MEREKPEEKMGLKRVLCVDDDPDSRLLVHEVLAEEGYAVDEAGDGNEALEKAESGKYDLILLDLIMPGLSGIDFLKALRARDLHTRVVIVTGRTGVTATSESFSLGAVGYITKPVDPTRLLTTVNELLEKS